MPKYLLTYQTVDTEKIKITGTQIRKDEFEVDPEKYIEVEAKDKFHEISNLLSAAAQVYTDTETKNLDNLSIESVSPLAAAKIKVSEYISEQFRQRLEASVSMADYYEMMVVNNELCDRGIFITDDNREQKYLDIVNAGEPAMIKKLERYLDVKERISQHIWFHRHYVMFFDELRSASSVEEVYQIQDKYLSLY